MEKIIISKHQAFCSSCTCSMTKLNGKYFTETFFVLKDEKGSNIFLHFLLYGVFHSYLFIRTAPILLFCLLVKHKTMVAIWPFKS